MFAVRLHQGRYPTPQSFGSAQRIRKDDDGKVIDGTEQYDYRAVAKSDAVAAKNRTHDFGSPRDADNAGAANANGMAMRFTAAERPDDDVVRFWFEQGVKNRDGTLLISGQPDVPLKNKPTLHPYRAVLIAGDADKIGLVAVETRGRSCPVEAFVRGLSVSSEVPWRLQLMGHLAGELAMTEFLRNATITQAIFDRWFYTSDGTRDTKDVSLAVKVDGVEIRNRVLEWKDDFFARRRGRRVGEVDPPQNGGPAPTRKTREQRKKETQERKAREALERVQANQHATERSRSAAQTLREEVFVSRSEQVNVDFDDVGIEMDNDDVKKRITPNTDFGKFTYVVAHTELSDDRFFREAEKTLRSLLPEVSTLPFDESR
ncbi:hypothetical protein HQO44_09600 [Rhodococcus fascians]|nr:hypothetical protein [Rhodococcus fascians]